MQHRITIRVGLIGRGRYQPVCSCGWVGMSEPTERAAERSGDDHVVAIAGCD